MKRNPITLVTGAVLALIFALMLFAFQVRKTEIAVVTTFGQYSASHSEPGLYWRLPWPIQKIYRFDNRIQTFETKFEQTMTRAEPIMISVYVGWKITDPNIFLKTVNGDVLEAERRLEPLVRNFKNGVIGQHPFSDLISTNSAALKFDQIEEEMLKGIQAPAQTNYGIRVELLGIKQLGLPESVTTAVFTRMRAERQTRISELRSQGEARASFIRSNANSETNNMLTSAEAEATIIRGDAEREAAKYYEVFAQEPALAIFLWGLKALEVSLKERATLILDHQTTPFNLLNSQPGDLPSSGVKTNR